MIDLVERGELVEERLDASVRRLLAEKFTLGLFDNPFLDEDEALETVGRAVFAELGASTQRSAIVRLTAADPGSPAAPLSAARVYVEGIAEHAANRLGQLVDTPQQADLAVLRLSAPFQPRPGGFESFFHAGALEFPPDELGRILSICRAVSTIVVI